MTLSPQALADTSQHLDYISERRYWPLLSDLKYYFHLDDDHLRYPEFLNVGVSSRNASRHDPDSGTSGKQGMDGAGIRSDSCCQRTRWKLVSLARDGLTTAQLVPRVMEQWVCLLIVNVVANDTKSCQSAY
jgi:hypothetical protein